MLTFNLCFKKSKFCLHIDQYENFTYCHKVNGKIHTCLRYLLLFLLPVFPYKCLLSKKNL